jgi:hypothetical protein
MMKFARPLLILILFAVIAFMAVGTFTIDNRRKQEKADLVELSGIKYGLFNVDEWKTILATILEKKINELDFSPAQREDARVKIEAFLTKTISDFENRFYTEKSSSLLGIVQSSVAWLTGTFDQMKKDVPVFTEQILDFLAEKENRGKIKGFLLDKLDEYTDKTFSATDYTHRDEILARYDLDSVAEAKPNLSASVEAMNGELQGRLVIMLSLAATLGFILLMARSLSTFELTVAIATAFALLLCGLLLPMIEIDARLTEMKLTLLGEAVSFTDQVLYYRSKSILEVVAVMLSQGKFDIMAVGALVLLFSVIFPTAKLLASLICVYRPALKQNGFVGFLVFRTGKWSMADVMVVAIFMSYIGFTGILSEQLRQLERITRTVDIVATNQSALQSGFFLFTAFAILSLVIAQKMEKAKS